MFNQFLQTLEWLWPLFVAAADVVVAMACTIHIVLRKRDVRGAIAWSGLVWLAPFLGAFVYFCLGVNRIQRKATEVYTKDAEILSELVLTPEDLQFHDEFVICHPSLLALASVARHLTETCDLPGNRITPLVNGDEAYPAMLNAIRDARQSVTLLSYIFDSDRAGMAFLEALRDAHERGVAVRVLIDDVGSRYSRPNMVRRLRAEGIPTAAFLPTRVPRLLKYANLRNHRKIMVVDGEVGFTGGTNIREGHWLSLYPKQPVQCLHFRLEGPVVHHLQKTFAIDWAFAAGESLKGSPWFPAPQRAGAAWAQGIPHGPDEDFEKLTDLLIAALTAATQTVRIVTPYFIPDAPLIRALNIAALRDVDVRIYVPHKSNIPLVDWAAMAQAWQVLERGCRLFLTPPPFDHTKIFTVDGAWSLIGSTNWDPRSLRLNFEFNVQCFDPHLAEQLDKLIEHKYADAHELTLDEVQQRSWPIQLRDGVARLLSPYM